MNDTHWKDVEMLERFFSIHELLWMSECVRTVLYASCHTMSANRVQQGCWRKNAFAMTNTYAESTQKIYILMCGKKRMRIKKVIEIIYIVIKKYFNGKWLRNHLLHEFLHFNTIFFHEATKYCINTARVIWFDFFITIKRILSSVTTIHFIL